MSFATIKSVHGVCCSNLKASEPTLKQMSVHSFFCRELQPEMSRRQLKRNLFSPGFEALTSLEIPGYSNNLLNDYDNRRDLRYPIIALWSSSNNIINVFKVVFNVLARS